MVSISAIAARPASQTAWACVLPNVRDNSLRRESVTIVRCAVVDRCRSWRSDRARVTRNALSRLRTRGYGRRQSDDATADDDDVNGEIAVEFRDGW
jgi:hypothetical protein